MLGRLKKGMIPHRLNLGVFEPYSPLSRKKALNQGLFGQTLNYFLVIKALANFVR
jgi:hypothetical protein